MDLVLFLHLIWSIAAVVGGPSFFGADLAAFVDQGCFCSGPLRKNRGDERSGAGLMSSCLRFRSVWPLACFWHAF